ncbi:hypothetical protein QVD17_22792 [Tagetes erecta]|uniref:Uncharacterized protein n=1 Tax=Tagetes erecta TaxID=13708 RepID=A0AAD8KDR0_TARER|nr:hypothetical protein QVD17_22792 [Tagetes erecta]
MRLPQCRQKTSIDVTCRVSISIFAPLSTLVISHCTNRRFLNNTCELCPLKNALVSRSCKNVVRNNGVALGSLHEPSD